MAYSVIKDNSNRTFTTLFCHDENKLDQVIDSMMKAGMDVQCAPTNCESEEQVIDAYRSILSHEEGLIDRLEKTYFEKTKQILSIR